MTIERSHGEREAALRRLELWFMRDLIGPDRASLFLLFGISGLTTQAEQQREFRKILSDASSAHSGEDT